MSAPEFIGDELSAAGFRLAGLLVHPASADTIAACFDECLSRAPLVILTMDAAALLPPGRLDEAISAADPPVAVLVPLVGGAPAPDLELSVRRALGVES